MHGQVLLAEDVHANQLVAHSMLKRLGLSVSIADNGAEAVKKWRDGNFDLILMDCQMPEMDGYEATRHIRREESGRRIPVIALTANAYEENRKRCLEAGMVDFLTKPFELIQLRSILTHWLKPGEAEVAPQNHPPIHQPSLEQMRSQLGEDFPELIQAYMESARDILAQMPGAARQGDAATLERLAHSLKSASANVGAIQLSSMANNLEQEAGQGRLNRAPEAINAIAREEEKVRAALLHDPDN